MWGVKMSGTVNCLVMCDIDFIYIAYCDYCMQTNHDYDNYHDICSITVWMMY